MYLLFTPSLLAIVIIGSIQIYNDLSLQQHIPTRNYRLKLGVVLLLLCIPASVIGQDKSPQSVLEYATSVPSLAAPLAELFDPITNKDGNLEYRIVTNKQWDCRRVWNPDQKSFALICILPSTPDHSEKTTK